jgi:hypothetical protein
MKEYLFCKDCKNILRENGEIMEASRCNKVQEIDLVSGKISKSLCIRARSNATCSEDAKFFEEKEKP